jgi:hypothetical protein
MQNISKWTKNLNVKHKTIKILKENVDWNWQWIVEYDTKDIGSKQINKRRQVGLDENFKTLCIKRQCQQSKNTMHRMEEDICIAYR